MIEELNFVKGAVSSKDLVPVLTHFCFMNGRVQGGNGKIYMDAPCDIGGKQVTVPAERFIKAINSCRTDPSLKVTPAGNLVVKSGAFKAVLPLSQDPFPVAKPEGKKYPGGNIIETLQAARDFIGTDAARPWACGVLFKGTYCYATNNVTIIRVPVDWDGPEINLPASAIDELLRVRLPMSSVQVADNNITFHFKDRWLRSQLLVAEWPDVSKFFSKRKLPPIPEGLEDAVRTVMPFCPDENMRAIKTGPAGVSTDDGAMSAEVTGIALPEGKYRAEALLLALSHADNIDLSTYPGPCEFSSQERLRGVLVGLRA